MPLVLKVHRDLVAQVLRVLLELKEILVEEVELVLKVLLDRQESQQVLYCYGLVRYPIYHLVGCYVMVLVVLQI